MKGTPDLLGLRFGSARVHYLTSTLLLCLLGIAIMKQPGVAYQVETGGSLALGGPDTFSTESTTILINDATMLKVRDNFTTDEAVSRFLHTQITAAP